MALNGTITVSTCGLNVGFSTGDVDFRATVSAQRARRLADRQLEFVAGVSHELRTPLAVICSAGENLADGVVADADGVRQYGRLVRHEGRRLPTWWSGCSTSPGRTRAAGGGAWRR